MNHSCPTAANRKLPTAWQWLVILWVIGLNGVPYVLANVQDLDWLILSLLSAPFAQTGMLAFLVVAGKVPLFVRRLMLVTGLLVILGLIMVTLQLDAVGTIAWFLMEATVMVGLCLASAWLVNVPRRPRKWSPQFSLAEFLAMSGLLGVFLLMLRIGDATSFQFWQQVQETEFVTFAICSGFYLFPVCLATIVTRRGPLMGMILFCVLLTLIYPPFVLGVLLLLDKTRPLGNEQFLMLFYWVFPLQLLIAWGTLFPLRAWLPAALVTHTVREKEKTERPRQAHNPPHDDQDFESMT